MTEGGVLHQSSCLEGTKWEIWCTGRFLLHALGLFLVAVERVLVGGDDCDDNGDDLGDCSVVAPGLPRFGTWGGFFRSMSADILL